jgi:DNA-binding NarL/FixJ family response regulator
VQAVETSGSALGRCREPTLTCPDRYLDARYEVMTSYQSQEVAADVLRRGASGVPLKPFRSAELREVMARSASDAGDSAEKRFQITI